MHGSWDKIDYRKLGRNEHLKSLKRQIDPTPPVNISNRSIVGRLRHLCFKWGVNTYPGYGPILGHLLGIQANSARRVARGQVALSDKGRSRLIAWLELQVSELQSILEALRAEQVALDYKRAHDPKFNLQARLIKARAALALKQGSQDRKPKP